ncbi:DMT family transporter [Sulfitobacter aestuariivivens]|uniref:DMT family transporter n=1 Tax=Sulfitobacter aestuariivivens TaxID=2766981 RepID=UPI0036088B24
MHVGGMFLISINDMLIKSLSGGYSLHQLVLMRSLVGVFFTLFMLKMEGGFAVLRTGRPGLHLLRALLIVFANTSLYAAIVSMPLATATALYFASPLFVTLLSIPVLGERVGPRRFAAVGIGFAGVLTMMAPQLAGKGDIGWVMILPVMAAAGYACMAVLTRKLGATSRASALAIHLQVAFVIVSLGVWAVAGDGRFAEGTDNESVRFLLRAWVWPETGDLAAIAGLGVMSAVVGYLMTQAYRLSRASTVAPFEYVLLLYSLFWGWSIFGEWPEPTVFIGAAVIIAAGVYVFMREDRVKATRRT